MSTIVQTISSELTAILSAPQPKRACFLMCPPRLYDVKYVINPWMAGNVHASSRALAVQQWESLYRAVSQFAEVELVEPQPGWPDMVFTANAGLERDGVVALSSFFHAERQGEEPHFRRWFEDRGYAVIDVPRTTPFEGEGDALFAEINGEPRLFVGYGPRTLRSSHDALRALWGVEVASLELVDARFYHLDTCFAPLEGGYAMYFPEAFSAASLRAIEACYPADKRIVVDEADAVTFACNTINIGQTIILNRIGNDLNRRLETLGFKVIQVELTEFLKAGGAAKCLVMKLGA